MKKWLKKIVNFLLLGTMILSGVACEWTEDSSSVNRAPMTDEAAPVLTSTTDTTIANMDRTNMFGLCELPSEFGGGSTEKETTIEFIAESCKNLGVKSMRVWMHLKMVFTRDSDSDELFFKEDVVANYHRYFQLLKEAGVEQILVMNHQFIKPWDYYNHDSQCMPDPWNGEYDYYVRTLKIYEDAYVKMQKEFPEITYWEVGNEFESSQFLHKAGWKAGSNDFLFTFPQLALIYADLCWYANRGLKSVNPASVTVAPGSSASKKVPEYILNVYSQIAESKSVPTGQPFYDPDPDHYFQIMAWHPYAHYDTDAILKRSDEIYETMKKYGDGDKKVWFTECGFSNSEHADDETMLEKYTYYLDEIAKKPYAETIFVFRLTNLHNFKENALETNYGIMYAQLDPVNLGKPKYQAIAIYQWFYGKDADLTPLYWYYNKATQGEN